VLVGLSPGSALPFASFAAAAAVSIEAGIHAPATPRREARTASRRRAPAPRRVSAATEARMPSIFRSPSGPAPSQAPPAA
jgi:hypothetical protein